MSATSIEWTDTTKVCSECRAEKSRLDFPIDKSRNDGIGYVCKECRNAKARRGYIRKNRKPHGWLKPVRDGDKKQARRRINYLVEQGRIPHPNDLPCVDCADMIFVGNYRHEYDHANGYDGDNQLYVEPVCSKCHHNREEFRHGKNNN